jgi:hypothetical protein
MKILTVYLAILLTGLLVSPLYADIYSWTDEKGVRHFSNVPPADAENVEVEFKEYQYDKNADQKRFEIEQQEWQTLIRDIENDEKREKAEEKRRAEAAKRNQPPTQEELIEAEKNRLLNKISELEEKPLDYFGSFPNKRVRIGYYKYRLEALMQDPDKYFNEPVRFEGNVKFPEDSGS